MTTTTDTDKILAAEATWFARTLEVQPALTADMIHTRVLAYRPHTGQHQYQCPRCWIRSGTRSSLRSLPGTDEHDILKCNSPRCGAEFIIPF